MEEGEGFIGSFVCCVNIVQDVSTSCVKIDISMELWKHVLGVNMVKTPSQNEEGIRVGCLLFTDVLMEFVLCLTPVVGGAGRDVQYVAASEKAVNSLGR